MNLINEIVFDTKDADKYIALKDIENFKSAGCRALLVVNSNGFMCNRRFEFDNAKEFLEKIVLMNKSLNGEAILGEGFSENFIRLSASKFGHIDIEGSILRYGEVDQKLEFGFRTDQTLLQKLINDFEKFINF